MEHIFTERLEIRPFFDSDWQNLYEYLSDEEVVKYEPYGVYTQEQAKQEAANRAKNSAFFAVCLKDGGKLIGNIYFQKEDFDTWEIGYVFNRKFHGQGYAAESARALIDTAFKKWGARRVTAMCNPKNSSSWRLLERLNLRREGTLLQNIYFKTDEQGRPVWADTYEYAVLKPEWEALNT